MQKVFCDTKICCATCCHCSRIMTVSDLENILEYGTTVEKDESRKIINDIDITYVCELDKTEVMPYTTYCDLYKG